jgi:REP element-mobilizing transposase RayT
VRSGAKGRRGAPLAQTPKARAKDPGQKQGSKLRLEHAARRRRTTLPRPFFAQLPLATRRCGHVGSGAKGRRGSPLAPRLKNPARAHGPKLPPGPTTRTHRPPASHDIAPAVFAQLPRRAETVFAQSPPATCRQGDMRKRQLPLFGKGLPCDPPSREHGGDVRRGKRKVARPFAAKTPLHIVLRSSRATRAWSMLHPAIAPRIRHTARTLGRRCNVKLYRYANVGNHIHVLAQARSRHAFQSFLRAFAGIAARVVTGARRGRPVGKFWDRLAYTRIVSWGREFRAVGAYVIRNEQEALGLRRRGDPAGEERASAMTHRSRSTGPKQPARLPVRRQP